MTTIVMNEAHSLMPQQKELLEGFFGDFEFMLVPIAGWDKPAILSAVSELLSVDNVVVLSPIPLLLAKLAKERDSIHILHNDQRVKKELPNGKVIQVVSQTGWELIEI